MGDLDLWGSQALADPSAPQGIEASQGNAGCKAPKDRRAGRENADPSAPQGPKENVDLRGTTEPSALLGQSALGEKKESAGFAAKLVFQVVTGLKALGDTKAMSAPSGPLALQALLAPQEQKVNKEKLVRQQ